MAPEGDPSPGKTGDDHPANETAMKEASRKRKLEALCDTSESPQGKKFKSQFDHVRELLHIPSRGCIPRSSHLGSHNVIIDKHKGWQRGRSELSLQISRIFNQFR